MKQYLNVFTAYSIMIFLIILVGIFQSWSIALTILKLLLDFCCYDDGSKYSVGLCWPN